MDESQYTDSHIHPVDPTVVEFVAYERTDGGWDVYVFEPEGSCPEMEAARTDEYHIFIRRIAFPDDLEQVVEDVEARLGDGYSLISYYREEESRRIIGRIVDYLKQSGAHRMAVHSPSEDVWELWIRKKDAALARHIVPSNVRE